MRMAPFAFAHRPTQKYDCFARTPVYSLPTTKSKLSKTKLAWVQPALILVHKDPERHCKTGENETAVKGYYLRQRYARLPFILRVISRASKDVLIRVFTSEISRRRKIKRRDTPSIIALFFCFVLLFFFFVCLVFFPFFFWFQVCSCSCSPQTSISWSISQQKPIKPRDSFKIYL